MILNQPAPHWVKLERVMHRANWIEKECRDWLRTRADIMTQDTL